jgi:hypothetical protein
MTAFLQKQKEKTRDKGMGLQRCHKLTRGSKDNVLRRGLGRQPLLNRYRDRGIKMTCGFKCLREQIMVYLHGICYLYAIFAKGSTHASQKDKPH